MSEFGVGFKLSADASAFERGMAQATRSAQQTGKAITKAFDAKDVGRTLATALGINLENIANKVARLVIGFSESAQAALESLVESTGKEADKQERNLEKARADAAKRESDRVEQARKEQEMLYEFRKKASEDAAEASAKESAALKDASANLADFEHKRALEQMDDAHKLIALRKDLADASRNAKDFEDAQRNGVKLTSDEVAQLLEYKKQQAEIEGRIAGIVGETAKAESTAAEQVERRLDALSAIAGIQGSRQFNDATASALEEKMRRDQAAIQSIGPLRNIGQDFEVARLQAEIINIRQELQFRSGLQQDVALFGVEGARARFQGDPLAFDRLVQQLVQDSRDQKQIAASTNDYLRQLLERQKSGVAVVNIGKG